MSNPDEIQQESRQAVRIVDRILFAYNRIPGEQFKQITEDFAKGIPPYNQPGLADIQMYIGAQNALGRIRERDRDLGEFLQHLDTKIGLILKKLGGEKSPMDSLVLQEVNLSSGGIAFFAGEAMKPNEILDFHIVLLPDYTYVYCLGKVVNCDQGKGRNPEKPYLVSAKFTLILEEDKEKLIQHNFKLQSMALRNRRRSL